MLTAFPHSLLTHDPPCTCTLHPRWQLCYCCFGSKNSLVHSPYPFDVFITRPYEPTTQPLTQDKCHEGEAPRASCTDCNDSRLHSARPAPAGSTHRCRHPPQPDFFQPPGHAVSLWQASTSVAPQRPPLCCWPPRAAASTPPHPQPLQLCKIRPLAQPDVRAWRPCSGVGPLGGHAAARAAGGSRPVAV